MTYCVQCGRRAGVHGPKARRAHAKAHKAHDLCERCWQRCLNQYTIRVLFSQQEPMTTSGRTV